ncbi:type VI secretion system-associated FHA domain protein TagH [Delftia acidovorans]|uniref:type VI secretion system-associated FHA domain protein TagH n=1 Tax=Delftia acidovorans TaxID=80866 RepID=UPI0022AB9291|nr:type VI secretion system-associated FHA domain protein TagH [Delftia acidovorans]WAT88313.1 type VI secretion system-associated FHA domain protein TagH [Delftia acidovorans]
MDKIELRVVDHDGVPVDRHWHAVFGMAGGTIGRSGQNKLIISDPDASVARVHAMVRLDSEGAFVANLSERDPIWVAEQPVRSGQEVGLPLGARIRIGAYTLAAVAPGTPFEAPPSAAMQNAQNAQAAQATQAAAPPATAAPQPQIVPPPVAVQPPLPEATPLAEAAPLADVLPAAAPGIADPWEGLTALSLDAIQTPAVPSIESAIPPEQAALAMPQPAKPQHRPLLIPNDFDPFAPPPQQARQQEEGWAGLPSQGTGELIQQRHDGMVHTLPLKGLSTEALHDASHTGLPSCFEQSQKLDPLALFDQGGLPPDAQPLQQASGRGSELGQAFNLPRMQSHAQPAEAVPPQEAAAPAQPALPPVVDTVIPAVQEQLPVQVEARAQTQVHAQVPTQAQDIPVAAPAPAPVPQIPAEPAALDGLLPTNGLDLDLFKSGLAHVAPVTRAAVAAASPPLLDTGINVNIPAASSILGQGDAAIPIGALPSTAAPVDIPVQPQPAANADLQALAAAFMEGAGLNPAKTHFEVTPEFMRTFGEALRIAVQGTIDLLAARSEIKREFRAGVTIIATGANNPLKFLPNSEGVLMQMVHQTFPGFMKPLPAMQDAFQDLHVHQLALMAGIRAAYAEALTRFDPTELERRTETNPGLLDKLLTNGRKAALWDDYKHNFDVLRRHAEDDLMAFSGRTFVEAYENAEQSVKGQP